MRKRVFCYGFVFSFLASVTALDTWAQGPPSAAGSNRRVVRAQLLGYEEVPAVSSTGRGSFAARLDPASIEFQLSYANLEGDVTQAHIHIGQTSVNGGIMIFLCSNLGNGPLGTPECPQSGTVTGVRMPGDMVAAAAAQGIAAGEFDEVLAAIRSGNTYVNVHTNKHGGGEIRGQIRTDNGSNPHRPIQD